MKNLHSSWNADEHVWASLLSNHRKLFNEINSLRERLLRTHRPAKRAWLLRGRPSVVRFSLGRRGAHGGTPVQVRTPSCF